MKNRPGRAAPLIGITPDIGMTAAKSSARPGEPLLFLPERYARAISKAGGVPLILPIARSQAEIRRTLECVDGLLISGGDFDIHPRLYGEETSPELGEIKEERTQFELELISMALDRGLPLLGICGGAQALNVALGGTLHQDIASQLPEAGEHRQRSPKESSSHRVDIHAGTKLREILGREKVAVNSTHHQAIKKAGQGLIVNATAEDSLVEGIESREHAFVIGVQWHPECLVPKDAVQSNLFASLISACKESLPKKAISAGGR